MKTGGVFVTMLATAFLIAGSAISYKKYVNARYGYQVSYPSYLSPQAESLNGDGREFSNSTKPIKIVVCGDNNVFDQTSKERFEELVMELRDGRKIILEKTYNSASYFVKWEANGKRYLQRSVSGAGKWSNVLVEFPVARSSEFEKVSKQVVLSLSAPKRG